MQNLEINVLSATSLKDVNWVSRMKVYVIVSLSGGDDKMQMFTTQADRDGGRNPEWNHALKFVVPEYLTRQRGLYVTFKLRTHATRQDKTVGEVIVPVNELWNDFVHPNGQHGGVTGTRGKDGMLFHTYVVMDTSGEAMGQLNFSYKFSDSSTSANFAHCNNGPNVAVHGMSAAGMAPSPQVSYYPQPPLNCEVWPPSAPPVTAYTMYPPPPPPPPTSSYQPASFPPTDPPVGFGHAYYGPTTTQW